MNLSGPDVHQTLEYRTTNVIVRWLPTGLLMIFLGLFIFVLADPGREPVATYLGIPLALAIGSAVIGVALWARANPGKPLFALSPAGIYYRIPWVKEFLIPWREIQGVDAITIVMRPSWPAILFSSNYPSQYGSTLIFPDVTVVLVSKQFYDSQIFVRSYFLRGPGWKANFIPKGDTGPDGFASHARVGRTAGASPGGRSPMADVSRSNGRRAATDERAGGRSFQCSNKGYVLRRANVERRGDGRRSADDFEVGGRQDHRPADRHRRPAVQYRWILAATWLVRGARRPEQSALNAFAFRYLPSIPVTSLTRSRTAASLEKYGSVRLAWSRIAASSSCGNTFAAIGATCAIASSRLRRQSFVNPS